MTARKRFQRYKATGGAAGLVRVEVLVPPGDREKVIEMAAKRRAEHRRKTAGTDVLDRLFEEAVARYGKRCLWNVNPQRTPGGLRVIADTNAFRQEDIDDEILSTMPLSAGAIGATVRMAIEEARAIFERLPDRSAGHLFTDADGNPVNDVAVILAGGATTLEAKRNGNWPSGPEIDHFLIQRVVDEFGWEGSRLLDAQTDEPGP